MTFSSIVSKNFKYNFSRYISFYFVNSLIIAMLFIYGSLIFNPEIVKDSGKVLIFQTVNMALIGLILFSIVFITYANVSFLKNRGKEFGVYLTLGMTTKDLVKLIVFENVSIMMASLFTGILTGTLFGRLFYMGLNKMLMTINIPYKLNYKSFLLSVGIFLLIFLCNFIFNIVYIRKISIIAALKAEKKKEIGKSNLIVGIISVILLAFALYCLPKTMLKEIFKNQSYMIGLFVAIIMICPYIIIGSAITIIKYIFSKFPKVYNNNLLVLSNLEYRFLGFKNILYILSLLVAGAIFFVGYSYSIYSSTREYVINDNPFEIMFIESDKYNKVNKKDVEELINSNGNLESYGELEFIEVTLFREKDNELRLWTNKEAIISESNYNKHMGSNVDIKKGESLYITVANEKLEFEHPTAIITNIEEEKLNKLNEIMKTNDSSINKELLYNIIGENFKQEIKEKNIKEEKNIKFTNFKYNDEYRSGTALVIDDETYENLKNNSGKEAIKKFHLMNVKNEDIVFSKLISYLKDINNLDDSYWNEIDKITEGEKGRIENYRPVYREEIIRGAIDNNGMMLFTMMFMGILFVIANAVILYYKVFFDIKNEEERILALNRIGILEKEIKIIISKELAIIFFVPIIIGGALGMYFLYVMVSNSGMENLLMNKALIIFIVAIVIQVILYLISLRKYFKEVIRNLVNL